MPSGPEQAKTELSGSDIPTVRGLGRHCQVPDGLALDYSTYRMGCRGICAQVFRGRTSVNVKTFAFHDMAVAFLHRGTIDASFEHEAVVHTFGQGGLAVLPAGSRMAFSFSDADCTVIHLKPQLIPGIEIERFTRLEIVPQIDPVDLTTTFLVACVREELQSGLLGGPRLMESLGLALVNHIYARHAMAIPTKSALRGGLTARQVRRAQEIMITHLDESVPLATLAQDAGLSPWYFCRAFKQSIGLTPHQWMRKQRVDRARLLLAEGNRSLTSIAIDLGFASLSHFSSVFKQATGNSPTHYRRNLAT